MVKKKDVFISLVVIFSIYLLLFYSDLFSAGNPPKFIQGVKLRDSKGDIGVEIMEQYSVPCVVDWNADGKQDLLVGYFITGPVYLYLNSGTNKAPVFTNFTKIQADGADLAAQWT